MEIGRKKRSLPDNNQHQNLEMNTQQGHVVTQHDLRVCPTMDALGKFLADPARVDTQIQRQVMNNGSNLL